MPNEIWKGIFKLIEEKDELGQILGKLGPFPNGNHPDEKLGASPLTTRLEEELGDLSAALVYFMEENFDEKAIGRIIKRYDTKLEKFKEWGLTGLPK